MPAARTWIIVALSLACLALAHVAFTGRLAWAPAAAVGLLAILVSLAFRGPRRWGWRCHQASSRRRRQQKGTTSAQVVAGSVRETDPPERWSN